ncbi:MAG: hypothetical protein F4213_14855 [Boseongicola sp. SB0677_bin_26]|nr:hypothetical protein [Boseongicola sp. SB0665_bin_10]MYG27280.1 hypothetical protein [Boseongicola sp. SB0677_bin_26]
MNFPGEDGSRNELDPWRIILACLFKIDSLEIPGVVDATGLAVDWGLNEREDHSHKLRRTAYRPRINRAYEALREKDQLRVAFIICEELARREMADQLDAGLQRIGWRIDGFRLVPANETVRELFFPQGSQHDAYVHVRDIIRHARRSLRIVDPYLDGTVFTILRDVRRQLKVELLCAKPPADFVQETGRFRQQHPRMRVETRRSRDFHDRFIVIDGTACWLIGCSIKDVGNKAFMVSAIEDSRNAESLLKTLRNAWADATPLA